MTAQFEVPVKQFKKFIDPFIDKNTALERPTKYRFYIRVQDIPDELQHWMQTNPRDQNLKTNVSKAIKNSLKDNNQSFHLWNRGILLSASDIKYDNRTSKATIFFEDPAIHGNIDGGHTLKIILSVIDEADSSHTEVYPEQYVEMEVITGLDAPEDLAEARNTSISVDTKSMEELKDSYKILKEIISKHSIEGEYYYERIEFRQNQMRNEKNSIDVREIIAILNMFNLILYPNDDPNGPSPIQSFTGKEISLSKFLQIGLDHDSSDEKRKAVREKVLEDMSPIIPDIFELWDYIERNFTTATAANGARYGARQYSNYEIYKKNGESSFYAMFSNKPLKYTVPKGIMYPLVGAFRAFVRVNDKGKYYWLVPPIEAWEYLKDQLASYVMDTSQLTGHTPTKIGKTKTLWNSLFLTTSFYASRYK